MAGIQAVGSTCPASSNHDPSRPADGLDRSALVQQCYSFLNHGLAPSTHRSYASTEAKFISFCQELGKLHPSRTLQPLSIKVYLSGIRALHIKQGFPDPLVDCLRLQRVIRGIKRCQGTPSATRLPITDDLMLVIWQSLDPGLPDHMMFWAACFLGYFGFLGTSEFTVPNLSSFSPSLHLSAQDIAVDSSSAPSSMRIQIKGSKTDPFRKGCFIHIGLGKYPLCAVHAMMTYLAARGDAPGPLFLFAKGQPLTPTRLTDWLRQIMTSAWISGNFSSHSFRIGAATVAARRGIPDHLIQTMGRWSSNACQS